MRQIVFALGMQAVASTVLLGLGGWLVISNELTLGQLVASELIVTVIVSSFAKLGKHMESFYDVLASVDKLGILFDLPVERQDGLIGLTAGGHAEVKLRNVGYCSADGRQVLGNVNATIRAGDRIAITGTSCSGKSTLLDLLFGLRTPTQGQITLLGVELRELRLGTLRQHVALVRDVEVIAGSVADNVRLGRIQLAAADVRGALAAVGLLDDILRLPQQLDTPLTSTGRPLSSTQLRRLMLARACAGSPSLLLLDAALDVFPDHEADALLAWLGRPEHPWALLLVTGREALATACSRRMSMECMQESTGSSQQVGNKNAQNNAAAEENAAPISRQHMLAPVAYNEALMPALRLARSSRLARRIAKLLIVALVTTMLLMAICAVAAVGQWQRERCGIRTGRAAADG